MRYLSATDAKQRFAVLLDAAQREPITIRRQNRDVAVVISTADYERLRNTNLKEFRRLCDRVSERAKEQGLTEELLMELLKD